MAKHNVQARAKAARNEAHANKYPRRSPSERRELRAARTVERNNRWLLAMGIAPEPVKPYKAPRRKRRR